MNIFEKFNDFTKHISQAVGNNVENDKNDVRTIRENFDITGFNPDATPEIEEDGQPLGILTRALDGKIKDFQKENNLKVDGIINPGGETETVLLQKVEDKKRLDKDNEEIIIAGRPFTLKRIREAIKKTKDVKIPLPKRKPEVEDESGKEKEELKIKQVPAPVHKPDVPEEFLEKEQKRRQKSNAFDKKLLDFIGRLESSDNYNIVVGGKEALLTEMTIKEIQEFQKRNKDRVGTPVGRYQIKDATLDYLIQRMDLNGNELYDEEMQDKMGLELLKKRGLEGYKEGKYSDDEFILFLSQEWAALPKDSLNESFYKYNSNNKALTDYKTMKELVKDGRFKN